MIVKKYSILLISAFLSFALPAFTQLRPASIFSDHMVLQRDQPIKIWGKAIPGQKVFVTFGLLNSQTITKNDSFWQITFPKHHASKVSRKLEISSANQKVVFSNILIGDIWLCIGQSNMEWPMSKEMHYHEEIKDSDHSHLRFFNPTYAGKNIFAAPFNDSITEMLNPSKFFKGIWKSCDSLNLSEMSAVAYYFGKNVWEKTDIPIGLIHLGIGGAPLETFIDPMSMKNHMVFSSKMVGNWLENHHLPVWIRERAIQNIGTSSSIPFDQNGKNHAFKPGFAYTAGILPLKNLPIKGVLCYQGESNAQETDRVNEYADLFELLVLDYRRHWNNQKLPVYFAQLSSIDTFRYKGHLWPKFRDEQRKIAENITHCGMAVTADAGDRYDVHPRNKKIVGDRLSFWALSKTYGYDIPFTVPIPPSARFKNGHVIITFKKGEKLRQHPLNGIINGFTIDGKHDFLAKIEKNKIIIKTDYKPQYVYYGWSPFSNADLYNNDLIPVSTFKLPVK
jgi:sialate O-acetylesterase